MLPEQVSQRRYTIARSLYAQKGPDKPKAPKVTATKSSYKDVGSSTFDTDFASGSSLLKLDPTDPKGKRKIFESTASLAPGLAGIAGTATHGLGAAADYMAMDPNQRISFMTGGQDPFYNVLTEQANRERNATIGRAQVDAGLGGVSNSTTFGSALGKIYNDDLLRRNQILLSGLDARDRQALMGGQFGLGTITGLNSLMTPIGSAAASQLQSANSSKDAASAATASAMNNAAMQQAQAMNAYNQQQSSGLGNMIGTGLGVLAAIPSGGTSLLGAGLGAAGGYLGGLFGRGGGGGGGSGYYPAYSPMSGGSYFGGPSAWASNPASFNLGGLV